MIIFQEKIVEGASSQVFLGYHVEKSKEIVIKVDRAPMMSRKTRHQASVLMALNCFRKGKGIPKLYRIEEHADYSYLVMRRLGLSVEKAFLNCGRTFDGETIKSVYLQALNRIKLLHSIGYIHGDIKPSNFLFGLQKQSSTIFMIDFGFARKYRDSEGIHDSEVYSGLFRGSLRFASLNAHAGKQLSRRDDMESLCYMLLYLIMGHLPWENCPNQAMLEVSLMKQQIIYERIPHFLLDLLSYTRSMAYDEEPDYERYADKIRQAAEKQLIIQK